ncbi:MULTISPECIES: DUF4175 domain-containing protein [Polyangium]|uniref:Lmo0937 family membrane protein n=1 Tax=Polyangium sorediatum TaxID=889274 RepID=A0ABT6NXB1_9BACT|nr:MULTISPECIES: DUF4175 domain-containing protein [Polyangium]MDI1432946.1 hypothetical protein [Polyangium sorediatum]
MLVFWGLTIGAFLAWLLAVTGVYQAGPWIHVLLVISIAFAVTGLLFRPIGRR